ncbi:hypothetical protein BDR06DRAFT_434580 [Suillus hirtellus]|nr:hypothetical protein BDR06DRAFT_434580 [Suillus hirtellus]
MLTAHSDFNRRRRLGSLWHTEHPLPCSSYVVSDSFYQGHRNCCAHSWSGRRYHSRWPVESGLISVLSLLGCCGPQRVSYFAFMMYTPRGSYGTHHLANVTFTALVYLSHTPFCVAGTYGYSTGFDTCP